MSKQLHDPLRGTFASIPTGIAPPVKTTQDTHNIVTIHGYYGVFNSDSGREVARFDKYGDALAEQARRNALEAARGVI